MMKVDWVAWTDPVARATAMLTAANPMPNSSVKGRSPTEPTSVLGEADPDREPEGQQDEAVQEDGEHLPEQVPDHQRGAVGRSQRQLVPVAAGDVQDQALPPEVLAAANRIEIGSRKVA